ncbi:hypothetical protein XENTR_v10010744 [Xenopus tropicalis]|nr:hypothetical protein XENTR_v10010744 [Xenopus tropicalis]
MELRAFCVILLITFLAVSSQAAKNKKEKGKKGASDCTEWTWGRCIPNSKDCGAGTREGTCKEETRKLKCKIPCNWKKAFGGKLLPINFYGCNSKDSRPSGCQTEGQISHISVHV